MENQSDLKEFLSFPKSVVLIAHRNPDGDALGSCLALSQMLAKKGHACQVIMPSDFPYIFNYLEGIDDVIIYDHEVELSKRKISQAEAIFCMDFNSLERVDKMAAHISESDAVKILIDHHIDPEPFTDYELSDTSASSTCELVYRFAELLDYKELIDKSIGEALITGIITDTGCFRYATNAEVYRIAGELKKLGVDDYMVNDRIFNSMSEKQLRLLGHCLANRTEILEEHETGLIWLNKADFQDFDIQRGDTEGIINYLMMVKKIKIAAFFRQQPTIIKISLRSKGNVSVQELARDHFNGGGHKNASGGSMHSSLKQCIEKFKSVIPKYSNQII